MTTHIVIVGTDKGTARGRYAEFAGEDVWGPFTQQEAEEFATKAREVWEKQEDWQFVYGKPYARVQPLRHDTHPFHDMAAMAARNCYMDPDGDPPGERA